MQVDEMSFQDQVLSSLQGFENFVSRETQSVQDSIPTSSIQQRNSTQQRPPSLYVVIPEPDDFDLSLPQNLVFSREEAQNERHTPPPSYQDVLKADDLFDLSNPPPSYVDATVSPPACLHPPPHIPRETSRQCRNNVDTRVQYQTNSNGKTLSGLPSWLEIGIPVLSVNTAAALCIMNCFLPGIGPTIAGFMVLCCGKTTPSGDSGRCCLFCVNILIGLGQLILASVVVGLMWAAVWGAACANIAGKT